MTSAQVELWIRSNLNDIQACDLKRQLAVDTWPTKGQQ